MNFTDTTIHFSAAINFFEQSPTPRKVTVMGVNVCKHQFTCTNVTPKKKKETEGILHLMRLVTMSNKRPKWSYITTCYVCLFANENKCVFEYLRQTKVIGLGRRGKQSKRKMFLSPCPLDKYYIIFLVSETQEFLSKKFCSKLETQNKTGIYCF